MWSDEYADCLSYIDSFWDKVTHSPTEKKSRHAIAIPHHYIVPNDKKFNTIFYWDSYFMFRGLMGTKRSWLMKEMVENFIYLFKTLTLIPNSNLLGLTGRSQPPFLTSMILDVFLTPHYHNQVKRQVVTLLSPLHTYKNKQWLKEAIEVAKKEYMLVWMDVEGVYNHKVEGYPLARYGDRDIGYAHSSEIESGWDFTSRFYSRCNEFLPVDLNVYLYKYEKDFTYTAPLFPETQKEVEYWQKAAEERKNHINTYMWNETEGFYFDYGYNYKRQSDFYSLAGFTPLWAGIPTLEQAQRMVNKLDKFESEYGLFITAKESLAKPIDLTKIQKRYRPAIEEVIIAKQWDYPSIWSPLEYLTVIGLLRYGFIKEAKRIMTKSVKAHAALFRKHGTFFEKINGETGEPPGKFHYTNQSGFGWTNAAFYRYIKILDILEKSEDIYCLPKPAKPPYQLTLLQ